jgi:hypothetical protein
VIVMADVHMDIALALARGLASDDLALSDELSDVELRAQLVDEIDRPLLFDGEGRPCFDVLGAQVRHMATRTERRLPGIADPLDRAAVALRLWAGCLMAAKTIATETRNGPNTGPARAELFAEIDRLAAGDPVFLAGVEAAPAFKRRRRQSFELDGVPEDSAVRRFA